MINGKLNSDFVWTRLHAISLAQIFPSIYNTNSKPGDKHFSSRYQTVTAFILLSCRGTLVMTLAGSLHLYIKMYIFLQYNEIFGSLVALRQQRVSRTMWASKRPR
jgi:hypothetical protein